jgi:hypothetical protein
MPEKRWLETGTPSVGETARNQPVTLPIFMTSRRAAGNQGR